VRDIGYRCPFAHLSTVQLMSISKCLVISPGEHIPSSSNLSTNGDIVALLGVCSSIDMLRSNTRLAAQDFNGSTYWNVN
jgi:hypothetical protein